jgi:hypothetical protein
MYIADAKLGNLYTSHSTGRFWAQADYGGEDVQLGCKEAT